MYFDYLVITLEADKLWFISNKSKHISFSPCACSFLVTPLDVVKIRMQAQLKPFKKGSCFIYSNGLMDHLCICNFCNGNRAEMSSNAGASSSSAMAKDWYRRPGAFNGTIVRMHICTFNALIDFIITFLLGFAKNDKKLFIGDVL